MNLRDFNPVSLGGNWTEQKAVTQDGRSVLFYRDYPTASTPMLVVFESDDEGWESPLVEEPCATFQEAMSRLRSLTVHGPTQPKCDVLTLAREFQRTVRDCFFHHPTMEWEGADDEPTSAYWQWARGQQAILAGIDQKNRDGGFDKTIDHLADATDANEYMIEAWDVAARCRLMAGSWVHANLTNGAWQKAKEWGYAMPDPSDLPRPCGDCGRAVAYNFAADDWEHVGSTECFLAGPGQDDAQYAPADPAKHPADLLRVEFVGMVHDLVGAATRLSVAFDLHRESCEDIMLNPAVQHFNPLPMAWEARHPLEDFVTRLSVWKQHLNQEVPAIAWDACVGCDEYVFEGEHHGDGDEWLCGDCYGKQTKSCAECKRTMTADECGDELPEERVCDTCAGIEADAPTHDTDSCEDAGCSEHGIDAMPDRWAEPDPVVQVLCDCGAHSECPESKVPDQCPGCGEQPLFNHMDPTPAKVKTRASLLSAMNEAIDGLNILNGQFDLQQVEDIMLDPSVEHFNPLPMDLTKRHPLSELVDAMRTWRDNLRDPSLAWAVCAGCEEYVVEAGVSGQFMEGIGDGDEWRCPACHEAQ